MLIVWGSVHRNTPPKARAGLGSDRIPSGSGELHDSSSCFVVLIAWNLSHWFFSFFRRCVVVRQFDIDEFLVPMGELDSLLPLLEKLDKEGTKIISFASWRAWPRRTHINDPIPINDKTLCGRKDECFELSVKNNVTMLEAYNCDRFKPGGKQKKMPAEKQLYRTSFLF